MSDSDAFIISTIRATNPIEAIRQAVEKAEVQPSRVQDAVFGLEDTRSLSADEVTRGAGLTCPAVTVASGLRAVFFAGQSILSGDAEIVMAVIAENEKSLAIVLASPDAVGRWNLVPRARLAVRSLTGIDSAVRAAGLAPEDVSSLHEDALSIKDVLDELEQKLARWGAVTTGGLALLIERI